jgi:hypothetical protein
VEVKIRCAFNHKSAGATVGVARVVMMSVLRRSRKFRLIPQFENDPIARIYAKRRRERATIADVTVPDEPGRILLIAKGQRNSQASVLTSQVAGAADGASRIGARTDLGEFLLSCSRK